MLDEYFLDIPVYWRSEAANLEERDAIVSRWIASHGETMGTAWAESHGYRAAPPSWRYNDIVGWIALRGAPDFIKGDLWWTTHKRIGKGYKLRQFDHVGKVLECRLSYKATSGEIFAYLRAELVALNHHGSRLRERYLDLDGLDQIGPVLNWRELLGMEPR